MLSFDLSAIDIVLLVAVLVLFVLYATRKPETSKKEPEPESHANRKTEFKPIQKVNTAKQKPETTKTPQLNTGFQKCVHEFGYLKNLPRNTPIPEECFGCPQVMQCLFPNE